MPDLLTRFTTHQLSLIITAAKDFIHYRHPPSFSYISFIANDDPEKCLAIARIIQQVIDLYPFWWQTHVQAIHMLWTFQAIQRAADHQPPSTSCN